MWGGAAGSRDCNRFYHYPYVYYPQNFYGSEYYRSSDSMYYRYPAEMQILCTTAVGTTNTQANVVTTPVIIS